MSSTQTAVEESAKPKAPFNEIWVELTFEGYDPMLLKYRRKLTEEEKVEKQHFVGLPTKEKEEQETSYRRSSLSKLLIETPIGLPNYPDAVPENETIAETFVNYFLNPDNEDLLDWIYSIYQTKLYPKEIISMRLAS